MEKKRDGKLKLDLRDQDLIDSIYFLFFMEKGRKRKRRVQNPQA